MAGFVPQLWLLGAFFLSVLTRRTLKVFKRRVLVIYLWQLSPTSAKSLLGVYFKGLLLILGVASFGPQPWAILKLFWILEFGGRSSSSRDLGIIPGQKKLFQVLKQTKCFSFPLQPFTLHMDLYADEHAEAEGGRRRWGDERGAGGPPGRHRIFPSLLMVEGSTLPAAFLCAK